MLSHELLSKMHVYGYKKEVCRSAGQSLGIIDVAQSLKELFGSACLGVHYVC